MAAAMDQVRDQKQKTDSSAKRPGSTDGTTKIGKSTGTNSVADEPGRSMNKSGCERKEGVGAVERKRESIQKMRENKQTGQTRIIHLRDMSWISLCCTSLDTPVYWKRNTLAA